MQQPSAPDTFPKFLLDRAGRHAERTAMREKDLGIWLEYSWGQIRDEVRALACGLAAKGLQRGDKVAIIGDNRPQLYWAMVAAQCLGGVPVPLYQDAVADEMQFVLEHAETRFAIVEDQEQVDKLLLVMPRCPQLELIVYDDPRGLRHYSEPFLFAFEAIQAAGRDFDAQQPGVFRGTGRPGQGRRPGGHSLHLRHHGATQGRHAVVRQRRRHLP